MIPHLQDREQTLTELGWTGRDAAWIAPHAAVRTRSRALPITL